MGCHPLFNLPHQSLFPCIQPSLYQGSHREQKFTFNLNAIQPTNQPTNQPTSSISSIYKSQEREYSPEESGHFLFGVIRHSLPLPLGKRIPIPPSNYSLLPPLTVCFKGSCGWLKSTSLAQQLGHGDWTHSMMQDASRCSLGMSWGESSIFRDVEGACRV